MSGSRKDVPYEERRNPNLPWGYWLVIDAIGDPRNPLLAEDGRRWESVRAALWRDRLSMGNPAHPGFLNMESDQLEFLLAVLASIHRRVISIREASIDLFGGSWQRTAHYALWLTGLGLIEPATVLANAKLTPEGHAILVMLAATRERAIAHLPVGSPSLHRFAQLRPDIDAGVLEAQIAAVEAELSPLLPGRFVRTTLGAQPAVVLVGPADADLLHHETLWSISLPSIVERDRFYLWVLARADRWERWLSIVTRREPRALTEHLLTLFLAQFMDVEAKG